LPLEKKKFVNYKTDEEKYEKYRVNREIISISISKAERRDLDTLKKEIHQPKDSTAIKMLARVGAVVIHDPKTRALIEILFKNIRNNERTGIIQE